MTLRWWDKILIALSGLVLIALGVCVILAAGGVIELPAAIAFDTWLGTGWQWMPVVFLAGALMIIWGLVLLIRPFRRSGDARGKYYTLQSEPDGNVRISVSAIDHLVRRCIDAYGQVATAKVKIGGQEDAMTITLHLTLTGDVQIPSLIEELRDDIKRSLQHSAGVTVQSVQVYVDATKDDRQDGAKLLTGTVADSRDAVSDPINTVVFSKTPVVVTDDPAPDDAPAGRPEPTVAELKKEIDLGPEEPLPVTLSDDAFPFPEQEAGVPLEIYTRDVPIDDDDKEDARV